MAVTLSLSITQNSQNTANATSNVTVKATAKWTYGSYNATGQCTGSITIDGTKYSFSGITFNTGKTTSGSEVVMTKTVNVSHNSDGRKTLNCSASFVTGVSSGTISASESKTLTMIPRKSTLTVANGTLGTEQTLTITEQASTFKHKLKYVCGDASGWILGGSSAFSTANSVEWTPPLSLAQQNKSGVSVSITFTIYTYTSDGTSVGDNSYSKTFSIPSSVKPSVSLSVSDDTGYENTYGAYVQGLSKLKIAITASGNQGSTIKSYRTTADGKTYTAASFTTGAISGTGTLTISVTVTDSRGRTATASTTISVLPYAFPKITALTANRCDANGNANNSGAYMAVRFSSSITALSNKNGAAYSVQYKKAAESTYTTQTLSAYAGAYNVTDGVFIFAAETGASYNIVLTVSDNFKSVAKTAAGSSEKKFWSLLKKAGEIVGIAFGKVAEFEGVCEIGLQTLFTAGIRHPVLEPETDLNDVRTPNTYVGANVATNNYGNCPLTTGTFTLEVVGMGEDGQVKQRLTYCHKTASRAWERIYYSSTWGEWVCVSDFDGQLLWEGNYYMTGGHTVNLAETVSKQKNGIVLVFSRYANGQALNQDFNSAFIPKMLVSMQNATLHCFQLCTGTAVPIFGLKSLYIYNEKITGHANNGDDLPASGGQIYENGNFVLRYVIGV